MTDLLNCPFCNGKAKIEYFSFTSVECTTCAAVLDGAFSTTDDAIAAWNRRALPPVDGLEVVAGKHLWVMEEIAATLLTGDRSAATKLRAAIDHFSQASSVIAGLKAEVADLRDEWQAEYDARLAANTARRAAEDRISSLEEESKRLREALGSACEHIEQLSELLKIIKNHWIDYDHVFSISVHEADEFLAARQALEDHNG